VFSLSMVLQLREHKSRNLSKILSGFILGQTKISAENAYCELEH